MLTSIAGRSVIVTGASKGIGKGIAKVFARNGGKVLVVSRHLDEARRWPVRSEPSLRLRRRRERG